MKGVAITAITIAMLLACGGTVVATPPLVPPVQYEQFCENQKVSGTGVVDVSTSVIDKKIALEYYNTMAGDGDIELDSEHAYSQNADKLKRDVPAVNESNRTNLNLYETTKLTYAGETPLTGGKFLHSKEFYGGIGAEVQEMFSVNEMEKEETAFFSSTTPYQKIDNSTPVGKKFLDSLKQAGRDTNQVENLMTSTDAKTNETTTNAAHLIGIETKNSFNGTWGTDAKWHKIFYKDIKAHEMFTGKFEAEKLIKFHESPVPEHEHLTCDGIDC